MQVRAPATAQIVVRVQVEVGGPLGRTIRLCWFGGSPICLDCEVVTDYVVELCGDRSVAKPEVDLTVIDCRLRASAVQKVENANVVGKRPDAPLAAPIQIHFHWRAIQQ